MCLGMATKRSRSVSEVSRQNHVLYSRVAVAHLLHCALDTCVSASLLLSFQSGCHCLRQTHPTYVYTPQPISLSIILLYSHHILPPTLSLLSFFLLSLSFPLSLEQTANQVSSTTYSPHSLPTLPLPRNLYSRFLDRLLRETRLFHPSTAPPLHLPLLAVRRPPAAHAEPALQQASPHHWSAAVPRLRAGRELHAHAHRAARRQRRERPRRVGGDATGESAGMGMG